MPCVYRYSCRDAEEKLLLWSACNFYTSWSDREFLKFPGRPSIFFATTGYTAGESTDGMRARRCNDDSRRDEQP